MIVPQKKMLAVVLMVNVCVSAVAQQSSSGDLSKLKEQVEVLRKQSNYVEMVPLLEKILAAEPNDADAHFYYGSSLLGKATNTTDAAARKALRVKARQEFIRAKELKVNQPVIDAMIDSLPVDGADAASFSEEPRANALMVQGEGFFAQGKLEAALKSYQAALEIDPKLYHAALFCGDVYSQSGDFPNAEIWYQKAIAIDPNRETAYRYSATPLMRQGKEAEALKRYIEAFITEPYNKFAVAGLTQWATATKTNIGHPRIDIPVDSAAYKAIHSAWVGGTFAKTFPGEKAYRHSLPEEAEALRKIISTSADEQKVSGSMTMLKKLNDEGLLEAYILMARADDGIDKDHPAYLREHRDKLRDYVTKYVVGTGK